MEPWQAELRAGRAHAAWDLFVDRYRRLILATIRRLVPDHDDVMDVFAAVCESLGAGGCARLRRYSEHAAESAPGARQASVATWLVVVVRNLTIDWLRHRDGRRRAVAPAQLSAMQQQIHAAICSGGCSHVEAYEVLRSRLDPPLSFEAFLREVRVILRVAPCTRDARGPVDDVGLSEDLPSERDDPAEREELARRVAEALAACTVDVRLAVELFVVERLPAEQVARVVGWPNAKTVYNRVSRGLAAMRAQLVRHRIGPGDL
jgi:RNA polymerase sigma factor (sigma-70 family)